jgi:O-antigen chain-terminating methyltransferase
VTDRNDRNDLIAELDALAAAALGHEPALGPIATGGDERSVQVYLDAAREASNVAAMPPGETRMVGLKRTVMRLSRLFLVRQAHYNASIERAVSHLNEQVASLRARVGTEIGRMGTLVAHLDSSFETLEEEIARLDAITSSLKTELDDTVRAIGAESSEHEKQTRELSERWTRDFEALAEAQRAVKATAGAVRSDLDRVIKDIRTTTPPSVTEETVDLIGAGSSRRADAFYERFEDVMRGSDVAVRAMLAPYIHDLAARRHLGGPTIDIGCGRGEWLELLRENGFEAIGVDTNEQAVALCRARGLDAVVGDAIAFLRDLKPETALAVTGFHIVEHLPADLQIELVEVALRALRPGGLLILETPNPTNLTVGAAAFYNDPSHLRPVNPAYLSFLLDDIGFVGVETRFLHPRDGFAERTTDEVGLADELMWALRGPQDYAVVGRKPADPATTLS